MQQRSTGRSSTFRRISLLVASFALGVTGWFLLGESESLTAAESRGPRILALVDGLDLTEDRVLEIAASELSELDRQRQELIAQTTRDEVIRRLIELETARRGMTFGVLLDAEVATMKAARSAQAEDASEVEDASEAGPAPEDLDTARQRQDAYRSLITRLERSYGVEYLTDSLAAADPTLSARSLSGS